MARSGSSRGFPCQIPGRPVSPMPMPCRPWLPWSGVAESGVAESAPCPLIAAGFCEQAAGLTGAQRRRRSPGRGRPGADHAGGRGAGSPWWRGTVQRFRLVAFRCGVISRGGRGGARSSQPYLGPRGLRCPGDMMIDQVSPPAGMRPLSLIRPSAWPCGKGRRRLTADWRELAAVVPIGEFGCGGPAGPAVTCWSPWRVCQAAASASSPGSARM
jgi:hypothetical protein